MWTRASLSYARLLQRRPLATNAATTALLFGAGDVLAQGSGNGAFNEMRTLRAVFYGGVVFAPIGDRWYKLLAAWKPVGGTAARVAADQLLFAPFIGIPLYYSVMSLMEGRAVVERVEEKWWPTLKTNWMVWPAVQVVNFGFVPVLMRLLTVNVVSVGWNCWLLLMHNR